MLKLLKYFDPINKTFLNIVIRAINKNVWFFTRNLQFLIENCTGKGCREPFLTKQMVNCSGHFCCTGLILLQKYRTEKERFVYCMAYTRFLPSVFQKIIG